MKQIKQKVYEYLGAQSKSMKARRMEYFVVLVIAFNVILIIMESENSIYKSNETLIYILNMFLFLFFLSEYILRLWIADLGFRGIQDPIKSRVRFIFSFDGLVAFFALSPIGIVFFGIDYRVFRILRLFRVVRLNILDDYTQMMYQVFKLKGRQLLVSFSMVCIFVLVAAILMYNIENKAQPVVYGSILSSLWWSVITITTVGYGDSYPITELGRALGAIISLSGVFIMAVPIGILSSGFFEVSKSLDHTKRIRKKQV